MAKHINGEEIDPSLNATNYTEFALKKKLDAKILCEKLGLIIIYLGIIVAFFSTVGALIGSLSVFAVVIAWYFTWPFTNIEYEYTTSSGNIKFDKIYGGGRRRKTVIEKKIKEAEAIEQYIGKKHEGAKIYDFRSSPNDTEDIYEAVFSGEKGKEVILFRCTNKALKILKYYNSNTEMSDSLRY